MKSKITKIQNILMKGIAIIVSAMMTVTPVSYAATSLNDNGDFNLSIIDQILYGKVGATAKEIEKYFAEGHTTLYISSEVQLRALAEYVNSAHKDTPTDTCNGDHSCYGKEIILTKNIELSKEEWNPIGKALTTTATETSGNNNTGSSSAVTPSEPDGEGAIVNEELEDNSELGEYVPDENEEENTGIEIHTEDDEAIATGLFNSSEEIIVTSTAFEGTFDGNGYTISNLSYSKDNKTYNELINIGLFGVTGKNAKIKNLITNNFNINIPWEEKDLYLKEQTNKLYSAHYWDVGNIVGYNQGLIENCINNSDIYGIYKVGGISGYSSGNIKNCKNTGMVKGYATVGGIVGYSGNAIIENCINTANISGKGRCGGIVGYLTDGKINNCRNKGNIKGGYIAGGIVAQAMNSTISSANNYDSVDGDEYIGGILGYADKSLITEVLNNGEETKSIFGTQIHTGGIVGYINKSVLNRAINKMPVRGYSAVGGIAGKIVKCNVYYVYNMDSLRTDGTANFDVIGVEKVGGLVGTSAESSLRRSGTTAEVLGVTKCIGGAVGFVYNGTKYTDEIWGINKIASLGSVRLDIDNWTYTSRTNGTYNNSENPVIKTLTSTSICFGVSNIIGYIDANTESETVISNNYIFGNVVGMNGTGSAVGIIAGSVGKVTVSGIIRDERYTYISSKVKTSTDNREFEIKLKGKDENGQNIETASYNVYQTNKTTTHNKSDAKNLDYGLVYTDLICGYYKNLNNSSYIASSFYSKADLGNKYQDKLFTEPYEDDTVKNGVYGVEYVKAPNASDCYYDFKAQLTMQDTSNNVVMPIVNPDDELEKPVIGSTIDENAIGKAATKNVTGSVSNYSINYKLYKNNTEINTETFMKKGDKLKVTATINAPLVNVIDISSNLTRFTTETAPTLSLKNGNTLIATIAPKTVSNVTTSSTETTFTYEYEITDETTSNEKINKVSLNKVGTIYVVGTTSQITDSSFGESETMDILFDDVAPQVSTEMYVEQPLETNRYTAGKEILIKVTTNERIYGNYVLPELRVRFSKSGIGKYISSKDANVGYAKIKSSEIKVDGKTEWIYSYIVQEGDEGNVIVEYTKGTIIDRAGNTTYLQDIYAVSSSSTEFKGTNQFGKDIVINNIGFYKDEDCTQEISLNRYQVGDIYVKVELDDALYTGIREVINSENAPKLYFNGNLGTEVVSVKDGNTIVYKYDKTSVTNITLIDYVTLKNEGVKLYYGQSTIADGKGINVNSIYQIDVDNIYLDPNNLYNNLSGNGIYADTTLPTVDITAYKVDSLPTGNTAVNGEKIENDITNADIIRYRFRFSENVIGFSEDDVTVNFGTKSSVGLKKVNDRIYDLYVETNVEKENTKDVQVIVEQNAVQDLVYQGNVRRENTITVDKKAPILEKYSVKQEDGKIIVEATYDETISETIENPLEIKFGDIEGYGNVDTEILGNKVKYTYTISGADDGKATIKLVDKVTDIVGNMSDPINAIIENDITLVKNVIRIGNDEYGFDFTDFSKSHYYKENDVVTVIKDGVIYKHTVSGVYPNNTQMKYMKLDEPEAGKVEFSATPKSGYIDIKAANIYFDTVVPVVTAKVEASNPSESAYKIGDELIITATSSEKVTENIKPEIEVKFDNKLGKFNNGIAQYVETKENENETTSWVYRYVISDGDDGSINISYKAGRVTDIAGNSTTLTSLNNTEDIFTLEDIVADTTLPTVKITPIDVNNSITNKNEITYVFTWNEEVEGFNPNDITVNNGNKGTFEQDPTNKKVYTMKVTTNVETGNTGDIQVIVEKDAVQDKAGHGNVRTENVIRVDKQAPILISLEAFAESDIEVSKNVDTVKQYYKAGEQVTIVATFNENIKASELPELALEFSESGNAKNTVSEGIIEGNKITYTYVIKNGDNGRLSVKGFSGTVKDAAENETVVTKRTLEGNTIIADSNLPKVVGIKAIAPEFQYGTLLNRGETKRYGKETEIRFLVEFNEEVYNLSNNNLNKIDETTAPKLNVKFGNGETREALYRNINGKVIEYYYIIGNNNKQDNGELSLVSITGRVSDIAGNENRNINLTSLTEYEAETKLEGDNHIVADTIAPKVILKITEADNCGLTGTEDNYKAGAIITITATTNELVYVKDQNNKLTPYTTENAKQLLGVKFGTNNGNGQINCTNVEYTAEGTIFTYEYIIGLNDNENISLSFNTNTCSDIALNTNGNVEIDSTSKRVIVDTILPNTSHLQGTNDNAYIKDNGDGTYSVLFTEKLYSLESNVRVNLTTNNAPKLVLNDNDEYKKVNATRITQVEGATLITYSYGKSGVTRVGLDGYDKICDKAGNMYNSNVKTGLTVSNIKITKPEDKTKIYGKGTEVEILITFNKRLAENNKPTLELVFGEGKTRKISTGTINGNTITYKYIIGDNNKQDNGELSIVSLEGTNVRAEDGSEYQAPDSYIITGGTITADTKAPTASITVYNSELDFNNDNKLDVEDITILQQYSSNIILPENIKDKIEKYGDLNNDGLINVEDVTELERILRNKTTYDTKLNSNKVIYTITWSEPVYDFKIDDIEVTNGLKGILNGEDGDTVYKLEVDTTNEGRQIVKIPANKCEDIAGNENTERTVCNNVVIDYTKPVVRAKINGGKYVIDEDSNKSTLKEIIVVNEEILKFEYTWSDEDTIPENGWTIYPNVDNITVNSDIPLATSVDSEGTYYLYMKVTDKAGNVFKGRTNGFVVSNDTITLTPNTTESTNQDITVTVSYGTQTTGLTQERRAGIQGMSQSADPTKVILKENGVVYAEAKDIAGNKVYETLEINNIDKTAPTAEITYNTNEDGSVTATITLSDGRVTNNEGKTTYTFNENGEFTFEYEDALGNKGTATAKVTTIDKHEDPQPEPQPEPQPTDEDNTAPEITFNYSTTSATVGTKIGSAITTNEDAKISYKWNNGQWKTSSDYIRSYNITYTPATAGTYTLYAKAEDKAGNVTDEKALVFTVVNSQEDIKDPEIEFNDLTVIQKNGVKYVKVSPTYTVEELNAKINKEKLLGVTPTFAKLTSAGKLRTGSEIKLNNTTKYIVIVNGDVNCDGKVDFINDIIMINNYRIGKINNLSEIQILAGDINNSGTIEFISDIISMNNYRLGNINVL